MILIIEDERDIERLLVRTLNEVGHKTLVARCGTDGLAEAARARPDLVLLDLGLPDMDGHELLARLREWSDIPVIVLTARDDDVNKVAALDNGADDYLVKPFSEAELVARIRVALRHAARGADRGEPLFSHDGLTIDRVARTAMLDGEALRLTPIEWRLLTALTRHAGKVLTHGQLIREVWGRHAPDGTQSLRIHTQHLREKLGDDPLKPRFILTEPGIGYRFRA